MSSIFEGLLLFSHTKKNFLIPLTGNSKIFNGKLSRIILCFKDLVENNNFFRKLQINALLDVTKI